MTEHNKIVHLSQFNRVNHFQIDEIKQLLDHGATQEALEKIKLLLKHSPDHIELLHLQLIGLQALNAWTEVEELSERLLQLTDESNYYFYLTCYLNSLVEQGEMQLVADTIEDELIVNTFDEEEESLLLELLGYCLENVNIEAERFLEQIQLAIVSNNVEKQWVYFHKWKRLGLRPPDMFMQLLEEASVHPLLKTEIIELLKEHDVNQKVTIQKFQHETTIELAKLPRRKEHPIYRLVENHLQSSEQSDLTLVHYMLELFDRYSLVYYPFFFSKEDVLSFIAALSSVATELINSDDELAIKRTEIVKEFIKQIEKSNTTYLSLTYL